MVGFCTSPAFSPRNSSAAKIMARTHKSNYFPCRCIDQKVGRKCWARVTLNHLPDEDDVCKTCGVKGKLRLDKARKERRDSSAQTCYCPAAPGKDGQNRPHRKGSMIMCEHYKVPF